MTLLATVATVGTLRAATPEEAKAWKERLQAAAALAKKGDTEGLKAAWLKERAIDAKLDRREIYYKYADRIAQEGSVTRRDEWKKGDYWNRYLEVMESAAADAKDRMGLKDAEIGQTYEKIAFFLTLHYGRPDRDMVLAKTFADKAAALGVRNGRSLGRIKEITDYEAAMANFPDRGWRAKEEKFFADLDAKFSAGKTVHAKDFGWDKDDATDALRKAFNSDAGVVIVDDMGSPWETEALVVTNGDKKIVLEKGVVIEAKKNGFLKCASLLRLKASNLIIEGRGGNDFRMRKHDYQTNKKLYPSFEDDRHGIHFDGAHHVLLKNFDVTSSGGDGFCMNGKSSHVWADRIRLEDHLRQGCTLGAGIELLYLTNCEFNHTWGGEPMAGIDVEPWCEHFHINDVYVEDCKFIGNRIYGIVIANSSYTPFTMFVRNCLFEGNGTASLSVLNRPGVPTRNRLIFEKCEFRQPKSSMPIQFYRSLVGNMEFTDCTVTETAGGSSTTVESPLTVTLDPTMDDYYVGKNVFRNFKVVGYRDAELLSFFDRAGGTVRLPVEAFEGTVDFNGQKIDLQEYIRARKLDRLPPSYTPAKPDFALLDPPPHGTAIDAYVPAPHGTGLSLLYWAEKGRTLKFGFYNRITTWTQYAKERPVTALRPDGQTDLVGQMSWTEDLTAFSYDCPMTGFYKLSAGGTGFWVPSDDKTWGYSYLVDSADGFFNNWRGQFTGFFECPEGCDKVVLQTTGAEKFVLVNPDNEVVAKGENVRELRTWEAKGKPGVWSFRLVKGSLRFFPPLNGIFADDPANLPRMRATPRPAPVEREEDPAATHSRRLTLMSYNIRGGLGMDGFWDLGRSIAVVKKVRPDVLCLQEVDLGTSRAYGVNEPQAMGHILRPIWRWSFSKTLDAMDGEYGIGMLYEEKPLSVEKLIYPKADPKNEPRSLLVCEFKDYVVCSTHLTLIDDERPLALDTLVKTAAKFKKPVFIAGDFNSTPDSPFIQELKKHFTILSDTRRLTAPADKPNCTIDYVIVDNAHAKDVTVEEFKVLNEPEASDHRPLAIKIRY